MGAGEVAPGRVPAGGDQPVRVEVVHQSEHTRVSRLFLPEGTVICKEPLGPDAERIGLTSMILFVITASYPSPPAQAEHPCPCSTRDATRPLPS